MVIKRELNNQQTLILNGGKEILKDNSSFKYGSIRFHQDDFELLRNINNLTHFNLQISNHKPKAKYYLVKIVRSGFFDGQKEVPCLLDYSDAFVFECIECKEHVEYGQLTEEDFKFSLPHIKTVNELKQAIVKRYSVSLPHLSEDEILSAGVSVTTLRRVN